LLLPGAAAADERDGDPWQGMNRAVFAFNEGFDRYVLEPVAIGWDWVAPRAVQTAVGRFFRNIDMPTTAVNNLLQGKPDDFASDICRFLVNSTVGVAGFFDPATSLGMVEHTEDFGQTLAVWGVPGGPYVVLPFLGPSNPRDAAGLAADYAMSIAPFSLDWYITSGVTAIRAVNLRALYLEEVRSARDASLDYYVFMRNAYEQRRQALINDSVSSPAGATDELYFDVDDETE
jgi:phospholipid-binding lipoprotein MlaA